MLRALKPGTSMGDIDVGEIFMNFILEARCSYLAGVDLSKYIEQSGGEPLGVVGKVRNEVHTLSISDYPSNRVGQK
jgi:hypothetical protein